jgi:hypothetical protein
VMAVRACAGASPCRALENEGLRAGNAAARMIEILHFIEIPARSADKYVARVSGVLGKQVAREEGDLLSTGFAIEFFDPYEIFYRDTLVAIEWAVRTVKRIDFIL